jgi:hypothetical protein
VLKRQKKINNPKAPQPAITGIIANLYLNNANKAEAVINAARASK